MSTVNTPSGERLVLYGVSWRTYEGVLRVFEERHLRITYYRGALEIMTLVPAHERFKCLLRYLIWVLVDELGWNLAGFGSMTMKRRDRKCGLEPDECFWIQNEPLIRCKDYIDIRKDPPPDLVLETNGTRSALNRLSIYAALGVAEVWRFGGQRLTVHILGPEGRHVESPHSQVFPFFPMAKLLRFLEMRSTLGDAGLLRTFRGWVKDRIAAGWK